MKRSFTAIIAALLLFASTQAHALTYYLDQNNSGLQGGPWATVTLEDTEYVLDSVKYDAVKFTVDPLDNKFSPLPNFGLQNFYFNEQTGLLNLSSVIKWANPIGWDFDYSPKNSASVFGKFELANDGDGKTRANPLEFYLYSVTDFDIKAEQFAVAESSESYMFAAHITDFYVKGQNFTSAYFGTTGAPVPEPGTFALLGAGLLGLILYRKRTNH